MNSQPGDKASCIVADILNESVSNALTRFGGAYSDGQASCVHTEIHNTMLVDVEPAIKKLLSYATHSERDICLRLNDLHA